MQLVLSYSLSATRSVDPKRLLTELAEAARGPAIVTVSEIGPLGSTPDGPGRRLGAREVTVSQLPQERFAYGVEVLPVEAHAFEVRPGPAMPAHFGLARYPETVFDPTSGGRVPTRLGSGWFWSGWFSAEAALAEGVLCFLFCHLWVTVVLDAAAQLGCLSEVEDDTGFWTQRDPVALAWRAAEWGGLAGGFESAVARAIEESGFERRPHRLRTLATHILTVGREISANGG